MKILHVINSLGGGGRERRMSQVVASLAEDTNQRQAIISFSQSNAYDIFNRTGVPLYIADGGRFGRIKQYLKVLKTEKPDIVHVWLETPTELLFFSYAKKLFHYKLIVGFVADANPVKQSGIRFRAIRRSFSCADCIVSNSKAGLLAKKAPMNKSRIIYNGFDFSRFPENYDREEKRRVLGVGSEPLVVMCASMTPPKDWRSFFLTAKIIQDRNLSAKFFAIGGGVLLEENKQFVENNNIHNVQFLMHRKDVEEILLASDISMLFTNDKVHAEGVSNSIMEAMAAGLPVIATCGGGTAEIISDGINGFIVEPGNIARAAEILEKLFLSPNLAMTIGEKAKNTINQRFQLDEKTKEYCKLYNEIIKQ